MSPSDESLDEVRTRAALYVLGALPAHEASAVEASLASGDTRYIAEVAACRPVAEALAYAAPAHRPPAAARARVLARIGADTDAPHAPGLRFVHGGARNWQTHLPGVEIQLLQGDPVRARVTVLVRMTAGAVYPPHRHRDPEEIYLLEGELVLNGVHMCAGDYCSAEPGTVHEGIRAETPCVFLVTAGGRDELLA